ncbi:plexin-A1-like [Rhopalosiphum maidis]|uniref:plexin-A1-like n=1 Tax=Rhopalosiphum maidis TaxID=43146 RepID=UPI000EFE496E|nr:plexin-A1-like [Rhopalosiphum maidis]
MADATGRRKPFWNPSLGYIIITVILVLACTSHADPFNRGKVDDDAVNCSESRTCAKCAERPSCSWSLKRQTCVNMTRRPELLMVNVRAHCPRLTAVDTFVYKTQLPFAYKVKVSNDVSGFVKYLARTNVTCSLEGAAHSGTVDEDADTIECAAISIDHLAVDERRLMVYHYGVQFDGVPLRIDDGADNYFAVYDAHYCRAANKTGRCVECFWDDPAPLYTTSYYKRCSAGNACTGLFEYHDRRNATAAAGPQHGHRRTSGVYAPPAGACPDMTIASVEPPTAPWSGGATLVITVKNHDLLTESRKPTVTVAGRDCIYPKTADRETITCTVGPPKPDDSAAGPVHVSYGPLRLTSAQTFRFVYPEPTALSPTCGPVSGGTLLRIAGRHMDAGSTATVSVGPAGVPCQLVARREDHALCVTGPADGPAAGAVTVVFDKSLNRTVQGAVEFRYAGDPVLNARQPFTGIASGGTYVGVRGRHLACVGNATLYVDDPDGVRHYAGCAVRNDTFMECRSPALDAPRPPSNATAPAVPVLLNFGFRVHFAGHTMDLSPQPDFPGYRLYADPVFADFETDGRNVTINGRHMDRGYRPNVDLAIRLRNAKGAACAVIDTQRRQIVCVRPQPPAADVDDLRELYVTVGREFVRTVKRKKEKAADDDDGRPASGHSMGAFGAFMLLAGIFTGVCFMSLLVGMVYAVWYKQCDIRRYL